MKTDCHSTTWRLIGRIAATSASGKRIGELRKGPLDAPIHLSPERHDQIGDAVEPLPSPLVEFRGLTVARCQRIDLVVAPNETQREPFLALAAEFCQPM